MLKQDFKRRRIGARFTDDNVRDILEFFPGLACRYNDHRILIINGSGAAMLGYDTLAELEGKPFDDLLVSEYAGMSLIEHILADRTPCLAMLRQADGSKIRVEIKVQMARELGSGTVIVRAEDVSHRISLGTDIHGSEMRFRALIDNARNLICSCEAGTITFINLSGVNMVGSTQATEVVGRPLTSLFHPDYHEIFTDPEALHELLGDSEMFPARFARRDGSYIDVHVALTPASNGDGFMLEARDITAHRNAVMSLHQINQELEQRVRARTFELTEEVTRRKQTEEQLRQAALHDGLTGLPNRQLLAERLKQATQRAHRDGNKVAIIFIDLDGFKAVNDTYGHDTGDILLQTISNRLVAHVRETDTVARLGGDEFIIAYTDLHKAEEAVLLSQRILTIFEDPRSLVPDVTINLGASIGIAIYPDHGATGSDLIRAADEAMYQVKNDGKSSWRVASPEIK